KAKVYYSQFSILEALWVTAKIAKKGRIDQDRVEEGLNSIMESARYERIIEDSKVFSDSLKLHLKGHRDMIDNILYAYSVRHDLKFLTLDSELKNFIQEKGLKNPLITPEEIT
ncbi:MAG: PIN domain-containing protein, partial [Asgard group archaeon]